MSYEREFSELVEKIRKAKARDQETLKAWKDANKRLTDLGAEMQALIGRATKVSDGNQSDPPSVGAK